MTLNVIVVVYLEGKMMSKPWWETTSKPWELPDGAECSDQRWQDGYNDG